MTWLDRILAISLIALLAGMLALAGWPSFLHWRRKPKPYEEIR